MNMLSFVIGFVLFGVSFEQATVCRTNAECGTGKCCYIRPEFEVVSRRRQVTLGPIQFTTHFDMGFCEAYHEVNTSCNPLETLNGHCGCAPGTYCQFVPVNTMTPTPVHVLPGEPRTIYYPGPGAYLCVA